MRFIRASEHFIPMSCFNGRHLAIVRRDLGSSSSDEVSGESPTLQTSTLTSTLVSASTLASTSTVNIDGPSSGQANETNVVSNTSSSDIGAIVGGVLGGLIGAVIGVVVLVIFYIRRRRQKSSGNPLSDEDRNNPFLVNPYTHHPQGRTNARPESHVRSGSSTSSSTRTGSSNSSSPLDSVPPVSTGKMAAYHRSQQYTNMYTISPTPKMLVQSREVYRASSSQQTMTELRAEIVRLNTQLDNERNDLPPAY